MHTKQPLMLVNLLSTVNEGATKLSWKKIFAVPILWMNSVEMILMSNHNCSLKVQIVRANESYPISVKFRSMNEDGIKR